MLGHRGCRLSVTYPEILEMQVRRSSRRPSSARRRDRRPARDHDPAGRHGRELKLLRILAEETIDQGRRRSRRSSPGKLEYLIGTMIEIPRAALTADEIAEEAEFFSFGTNDLTQMTFGFSRDDINTLPARLPEEGDPAGRPVPVARPDGVGQLVEMGVEKGRKRREART
jgi:pyruvate, orthophosphate dikinase